MGSGPREPHGLFTAFSAIAFFNTIVLYAYGLFHIILVRYIYACWRGICGISKCSHACDSGYGVTIFLVPAQTEVDPKIEDQLSTYSMDRHDDLVLSKRQKMVADFFVHGSLSTYPLILKMIPSFQDVILHRFLPPFSNRRMVTYVLERELAKSSASVKASTRPLPYLGDTWSELRENLKDEADVQRAYSLPGECTTLFTYNNNLIWFSCQNVSASVDGMFNRGQRASNILTIGKLERSENVLMEMVEQARLMSVANDKMKIGRTQSSSRTSDEWDDDQKDKTPGCPFEPSYQHVPNRLLSALDGATAQEGRNVKLDPALVRPARVDLKIFVHLATQWQARELFLADEFSKRYPKGVAHGVTSWVVEQF
ncbi:hypothetical protein BJ742DRAFT_857675 [Cladochytrium replicatum]|nr:hypothetical protein BJ742DRAFT_857675 [Cladochytrium replicatum]